MDAAADEERPARLASGDTGVGAFRVWRFLVAARYVAAESNALHHLIDGRAKGGNPNVVTDYLDQVGDHFGIEVGDTLGDYVDDGLDQRIKSSRHALRRP